MKLVDHWIDTAIRQPIEGGSAMKTRRLLVMHFTSGASGQSSIDGWREKADGVCAHFVIERSGKIYQCRPCNVTCGHVGGKGLSRWRDPVSNEKFDGLNSCAIGIELANAGSDEGALRWARRQNGFASKKARHRNGGSLVEWEMFPSAQLERALVLSQILVKAYNLDDLTGHDCVAPERRDDPGPMFPMETFRNSCGFRGLPVVFTK